MPVNKSDLVTIRGYREEDKNFILSTMLRGLYYGNTFFSEVPKDIFMANYHKVVEHILGSKAANIRVACLKDDLDVILGYSICREAVGSALDFVFVKSAWRNIGIAKSLIPQDVFAVTHITKVGSALLKSKLPKVHFNPFLF